MPNREIKNEREVAKPAPPPPKPVDVLKKGAETLKNPKKSLEDRMREAGA
jgi:hypothetical protein